MNREELNVLVRGVAQRFERETGISITARALDALVIPALPHLEAVTRELDEGKVTVTFPRRLRPNRPRERPYSRGLIVVFNDSTRSEQTVSRIADFLRELWHFTVCGNRDEWTAVHTMEDPTVSPNTVCCFSGLLEQP